MNTLTLYELTSMVADAVGQAMPGTYWVEAELASIRDAGHCYMELVQKDILGATPIAKVHANCWRSQWAKLAPKFVRATGALPRPGMQLLLKVSVNFSPTFGFSLTVADIDPTYTIGDMARKRQEIIQQLKDEGVFDLQRELTLPLFCQRIAVISSEGAAGYGDFCNQLHHNERHLAFRTELFAATMQGEAVEKTVIEQLDAINRRLDEFDCVVIIRGGGATSDMSGFDSLALAENVANFPLPIITGIGHDRDECVLDMIAFSRQKTPTAVAAFLVAHLTEVQERIEQAQQTIVRSVKIILERQRTKIDSLVDRIHGNVRLYRTREEARLERLWMKLATAATANLDRATHRIELLEERVKASDPDLLLQRGYSMTYADGKIVKDAAQLRPGMTLETRLRTGTVKSTVTAANSKSVNSK